MTRGFSKAIITGNLVRDPEIRTTASGAKVCSFSVAVNRMRRDANGNSQEAVSYFDCSAWNKIAEVLEQYAKKGDGVLVSGRLEQRSWEDKTTGQKRYAVEIVVEDFNFIGGGGANGQNGAEYAGGNASSANADAKNGVEAKKNGTKDIIPEDIPDDGGEVSLDDIPF